MKKVTGYKVGGKIYEDKTQARKEEIRVELDTIFEGETAYSEISVDQVVELLTTNERVIDLVSELKTLK